MIVAVLAIAFAAAPTADLQLASAGFQAVGTDEKKTTFFGDYFAQRLGEAGKFPVTTPTQMASILGLERQRQLLGCSDESASCLAELAGALGSDAVMTGTLALVGKSYAITVKVTATSDAREVASAAATLATEEEILKWLSERAVEMGPRVRAALRPGSLVETPAVTTLTPDSPSVSATASPQSGGGGPGMKVWVPAIAGAMLLGGGVLLQSRAGAEHSAMIDEPNAQLRRTNAENGTRFQTIAGACTAAGIAAGGLALYWALTSKEGPSASLFVNESAAFVSVGSTF